MARLFLRAHPPLELPTHSCDEIHIDSFSVAINRGVRTADTFIGVDLAGGFMARNPDTGLKDYANPLQDSRVNVAWACSSIEDVLNKNPDLYELGMQVLFGNMTFMAALLTKFRGDQCGVVTAEIGD